MHPVIKTRGLQRHFATVHAVNHLDLEIASGEVVGLLGHNGAGKTTTIRLLAGLLKRDGGSVRVAGFDPAVDGVEVRRRVGVSTETPAFDDRLTAREGLRLFAAMHGLPPGEDRRRVDDLLHHFDLHGAADRRVAGYSKGMRQRLAIARAMLHDPRILLLDEPASGLDPMAARGVLEQLRAWRGEGRSVVLCTHDLRQAQAECDRVLVLEHGRVVAEGAPHDLAAHLEGARRTVLQIPAADVETALLVLRRRTDWRDVARDEDVTHPAVAAGDARIEGVVEDSDAVAGAVRGLVSAGVAVHGVERSTPTLEDVYFALHEASRDSGRREQVEA